MRVAVVTSHPIQYQGPWFRLLAAHPDVDLTALFCSDHGLEPSYDEEFAATFQWDRPVTEGYRYEVVPNWHPQPKPVGFWRMLNPALWSHLGRDRFDAVILVGWGYASEWLAVAAARAHGLPILLRAESHMGPPGRPLWNRAARRLALGALFRQVDAFLAIGSRNAALYRAHGIGPERIFSAPYAVDNAFFRAEHERLAPRRAELRAALGVDDERPIVVASGKLSVRKAPLDLLHAFARVCRERAAKLVFMGDGVLRAELEATMHRAELGDEVLITGFRNQTEIGEIYAAADLLAFPSHHETWGLVVNEAMLFGLPVICTTAVPAYDDLVIAGETGDAYPPGDVAALEALLRKRLANPDELRAMGRRARARMADWSFEKCVEGTVQGLRFALERC